MIYEGYGSQCLTVQLPPVDMSYSVEVESVDFKFASAHFVAYVRISSLCSRTFGFDAVHYLLACASRVRS